MTGWFFRLLQVAAFVLVEQSLALGVKNITVLLKGHIAQPHQIMIRVFLFALCCQMLRTCSLPDLSRLFSAQQDSAVANANVAPENNLEIEDLDEAAKDDDQSETEE